MLMCDATARKKLSCAILFFLSLFVILAIPDTAFAQVTGASLSGTIRDDSGAIIPHARVSMRNVATGVSTPANADSDGFYATPNLLPGTYEVSVSADGFATQVQHGLVLTVGAKQELSFVMKVGNLTQKVEVNDAPPAVELASSSLGGVVNSTTVVELPLNGRDWVQLTTLEPAVHNIPTQAPASGASNRANRGIGTLLSISGTRPQQNNFRLDGVSIEDYAGGGPGSVAGVAMGVDAIQEFSVLTSNYSAEYGRTSGGVVNATTRSGTNALHGTAYWFLRDANLDAKGFFDPSRAPFHRNQFGGAVGGPIRKDKTFFFFNYEGLRQDLGITNVDKVPSADARNGILHNADGTTTTVTVDPLVQPFLAFYPLPNGGLIGTGNTGKAIVSTLDTTAENFETVRIDHKFSDKDSIFASWFLDKAIFTTPDSYDTWISANSSKRQLVSLEETHVFTPAVVNSLRVGYSGIDSDASQSLRAINPVAADLSLGSFPGRAAAQLFVTGLTTNSGGLGGLTSLIDNWNSYQVYDDAFWTKGLHSIKFGFAYEAMQLGRTAVTGPNGEFSFGSLTNFLTNAPKTFKGQSPDTTSTPHMRQKLFGGYIQDDWRIRPSLTLNLGLRYEMSTVPTETQNHLANLATLDAPTLTLGSPLFSNPTTRNFEPRLGFAWDPFHDGKTAVRGAFGVFDVLPLPYETFFAQAATAPFSVVLTKGNLPQGSFPFEAANITNVSPSSLIVAFVPHNPARNYVLIWNLDVEHQLTANTTLTVGYVGNHGVHMINRSDDVNTTQPIDTSAGLLFPFPAASGTKLNPNFGAIRGIFWDGSSVYDALQVKLSKKFSHGFQVQGAYTFSKGLDTDSSSNVGDQFENSISSLFLFCNACTRGLSDFNIAHALTVNYIWNIPTPKNWNSVLNYVVGGWQLGGIVTAQTGVPFTPLVGGDPLGLNSSDPFAYPNRLEGSGCATAVNPGNVTNYIKVNCFTVPMATSAIGAQCTPYSAVAGSCANLFGNAGRNTLIGPGLFTWDFSLFKDNYIKRISESFNLQFRVEAFNIFNRANFAPPIDNATLFDQTGSRVAGAGAIDQTVTPGRQIQLGLKVIW